jgi:transposase
VLTELLHRSPRQAGLARSRWWLDGIRQAVGALQSYSLAGLWQVLKRLKLRYKRRREYLHSPDPDYDHKLAAVAAAYQQAQSDPQHIVLLYQDELTYYRRPSLAGNWSVAGREQPLARLGYRPNTKRRISGSLNALTGQFHAQHRARFGLVQLRGYYQQLEAAYPAAERIYLVQDNWPVHYHPDLLAYCRTSRITPLWLPTYAPWTNPTEKVWRWLKQDVLHLHDFADDWAGLQEQVVAWFSQWQHPSPALLHYVGLSPP